VLFDSAAVTATAPGVQLSRSAVVLLVPDVVAVEHVAGLMADTPQSPPGTLRYL